MKRFAIFLVLLLSAGYLLLVAFLWAVGDGELAKIMTYFLLGSALVLAVATVVAFLLAEVLKGCWYRFDRVWPD